MFFSGVHRDYHEITDLPDKINYNQLQERIILICKVIEETQNRKAE